MAGLGLSGFLYAELSSTWRETITPENYVEELEGENSDKDDGEEEDEDYEESAQYFFDNLIEEEEEEEEEDYSWQRQVDMFKNPEKYIDEPY